MWHVVVALSCCVARPFASSMLLLLDSHQLLLRFVTSVDLRLRLAVGVWKIGVAMMNKPLKTMQRNVWQ